MIEIQVRLYGRLRDALPRAQKGRGTLAVAAGATVGDVLTTLGIKSNVMVAVNGGHEAEGEHPLHDGDQLVIFEPTAGG